MWYRTNVSPANHVTTRINVQSATDAFLVEKSCDPAGENTSRGEDWSILRERYLDVLWARMAPPRPCVVSCLRKNSALAQH
jgi:hypothetical protein